MKNFFILNVLLVAPALAAVNVPLTVKEAVYPGSVAGVARTDEPLTVGVPLADSAGITSTSVLGLTGATAGQFTVEGRWPSGNIKWVKVRAVVPSLAAGGTATVTLNSSGAGNFGGSNLATDNGTTITVSTGTATFTIKKANFNVVDQVVVGTKTVVASGVSQGLVIIGPDPTAAYPGNVTCLPTAGGSPCTTTYASANDASSTAVIEENGPAIAVIKASGTHFDGSGHAYMHFTARLYFYKNKNYLKVTSILRNADHGTSNTFATAYKGFQGYELRITPNIAGTLNYTIANNTTSPTTGTLNTSGGTDAAYIYQAESTLMTNNGNWCNGSACVPYTSLTGFSIVKNGTAVVNGTSSQYPQGWADISDASGAGVEIGQYQLAAYGNKSLEFNGGGTDVRIGMWARENNTTSTFSTTANRPYYMPWPQWSINDVYLNFHAASNPTLSSDFLKLQHYLLASAAPAYYNSTNVFPYPLLDPTEENNYYNSVVSSASPSITAPSLQDLGTTDTFNWPLTAWRFYPWATGGVSNQMEFRLTHVQDFLRRGLTGGYLDSAHFYKFIAEKAFPMSDGFDWRTSPATETQYVGYPVATSTNAGLAMRDWVEPDEEHSHWYGMPDYYFLSGDETIHDGILEGPKDSFMNNTSSAGGTTSEIAGGWFWNARAVGVVLMSEARLYSFLQATGDPDAPTVLANAQTVYKLQVQPDFCAYAGYPAGCTPDPLNNASPRQRGVSRVRGVPYQWGDTIEAVGCPGYPNDVRDQAPFMVGILLEGLWEFRQAMGPSWANSNEALDLGYGITQWAFGEMFADDGTTSWSKNGFRYKQSIDAANACNVGAGGPPNGYDFLVANPNAFWPIFYFRSQYEGDAGAATWRRQFNLELQQVIAGGVAIKDELYHYTIGQVIYNLVHPTGLSLTTVPITNFKDNGGGSYTITWNVPAGATSYRIKWGAKTLVDWIGFDAGSYTFTGNPSTTMNWFAATDVSNTPAPSGTVQTLTIATGASGLSVGNFMVKAYATGSGAPAPGDTVPPVVSVTAPAAGANVTGNTTISATATDNVAVASVQFSVDGANLGSAIAAPGPYTVSWDSSKVANGSHTLSAVATDTSGNSASRSVSVSVNNTVPAPVLSNISVGSLSSTGATITWTTTSNSDTQLAYGTTASYGSTSPLLSTLTVSHTVVLSGLTASTTYHFSAMSRDGQGNLGSSADMTFTTAASTAGGGGTPIPTGTWVNITAGGYNAVEALGFEKATYVNSRNISCYMGGYKEFTTSEVNNAIVCYSYAENRWSLLQNAGYWSSTHAGEAGHTQNAFAYDTDRDVIYYESDGAGSSQPANGMFGHFWQYDVAGLSGRDKQTALMPWMGANGAIAAFAYDSFDKKLLSWNSSKSMAVYDPVQNVWITPSVTGTVPSPGDINLNLVYNPDDHKSYLYGGLLSNIYSVQCSTTACTSIVWAQITTTCSGPNCNGGAPPPRARGAMAYSTKDHVFLVCAGEVSGGGTGYTDTWIFNPSTSAWTQQAPAATYVNTGGDFTPHDKLTYDVASNVFVLVANPGGYAASIYAFAYTVAANYGRTATSYAVPAGNMTRNSSGGNQTWSLDPAITSSGGSLYAGWIETGTNSDTSTCGSAHHPVVQGTSTGGTWSQFGGCTSVAPESNGSTDASKLQLAYVNGNLWEAHEASNSPAGYISSAYARYWNGVAWTGGQIGCFTASCAYLSGGSVRQVPAALIANGTTPTVAVIEVNTNTYSREQYLYVAQYSGTAWNKMGSSMLNVNAAGSGTRVTSASLATDGSAPVACWVEEKIDPNSRAAVLSSPQVRCAQWSGSTWVGFGSAALNRSTANWASDPSVVYMSGRFYVGWSERTTAGNNLVYVCQWTGSACSLLGGGAINVNPATGWGVHPRLATDGTNLYVAWEEQASLNQVSKGYVKTWSGSAWSQVGGALAADPVNGSVEGISLTVANGRPTAIWGELSFGNLRQIYGMQWDGSSWTSIAGAITAPPPPPTRSACDLNGDGIVNFTDVQLAINQALGVTACTNGSLQSSGQCNVVSVQRVINASASGGVCISQ